MVARFLLLCLIVSGYNEYITVNINHIYFYMKKSLQKGFTLIELLVVIAIIAILSAIVITSLAPAQKKAKVAAFQSEVRSAAADFVIACDDGDVEASDVFLEDTNNVLWLDAAGLVSQSCSDQSGVFSIGPIEPASNAVNCSATIESGTVEFSDPCTYNN